MSRLQLALDVPDLAAAVDFYTRLFATPPHKQRPGYANFAIAEPPLKLVLFERADTPATAINHLGVEVEDSDQVVSATQRLREAGLATRTSEKELCCHAVQDKVWTDAPDGTPWEYYTIVDDGPATTELPQAVQACC